MDKIQQIIPKYKRKGFSKMKKIVLLWDTEIPSDFFVEKLIEESDGGKLDPADVRSCYGEGKRAGETMCQCYYHQTELMLMLSC